MNLLEKQVNIPGGLKEFFRPSQGKLILPLIFLLLPFSLLLIYFAPYQGLFFVFLIFILCSPFYSILVKLGLMTDSAGWFDMGAGPTLAGIVLVMLFYATLSYLTLCFTAYLKRKHPNTIFTRRI